MATRRERVVLDVEDQLGPALIRDAAAAKVLAKELDSLSGRAVQSSRELDKQAKSSEKVGDGARKAGPDIDRFSGRLATLARAAVVLGPALVPLGASTLPVLTAAVAGLGAAAAGIGATVLAFNGLGDLFKAMQDYDADKSAENLQALRIEMEKAGPAASHFLRYIDSITPQLKELQMTARGGLFPGVEDGIDALLGRLPLVEQVVNRVSRKLGELARDGGEALAGDEWTPFFEYMRREAAPTLDDFARATGNVALGLSNLLVAFDPVTQDFTGGLLEMSEAFADWSANLENNDSFQRLLDYIRTNGPEVVDLLGSTADALAGIVEAAAPWGQVLIPTLTAAADAIALIAKSPIGPPLVTAAAAMIAFGRAADFAEKRVTGLQTKLRNISASNVIGGLGLLATSLTDVDEKAGLANTAMLGTAGLMAGGPWGAAIGAGIGLTMDFAAANDDLEDAVKRANAALESGDYAKQAASLDEITAKADQYREDFKNLNPFSAGFYRGTIDYLSGAGQQAIDAQAELSREMKQTRGLAELLAPSIGKTAEELYDAAGAAQDFSDALSALNGWLDKREAIRAYRDSIDQLGKGFKDGFTREDAENVDAVGRAITQTANLIKDRGIRADFLAGARESLVELANKSAPKAKAEVEELIGALDRYGLTKPPAPKLDADDKPARRKGQNLKGFFEDLVGHPYNAKITADGRQALSEAERVRQALSRLIDKTVTVTVRRVGNALPQFATGGYTGPGRRDEPAGIVHAGEVVIPQDRVKRDWSMLKSRYGDLPGFADGGMVRTYTQRSTAGTATDPNDVASSADETSKSLKHLSKTVFESSKAIEKWNDRTIERFEKRRDEAKQRLDDLKSQRDSIRDSIVSGLRGEDIWADREASGSPWAAGYMPGGKATPQSALQALNDQKARAQRLVVALNTLRSKGITGPVLAEIIGTGDVERAEAMAALDVSALTSFATTYTDTQNTLAAAGLAGATSVVGAGNIASLERAYRDEIKELREIKQAIKLSDRHNQDGHQKNADEQAKTRGEPGKGHRRGKQGGGR